MRCLLVGNKSQARTQARLGDCDEVMESFYSLDNIDEKAGHDLCNRRDFSQSYITLCASRPTCQHSNAIT